ncbi:uncharacterized protein FTOL_13454 [Fusarium torulosum]|uniref:Uncharacterized protein n=1 Tax=Fusarium torulosum TaxID=33205 RepID=A0AAE8SPX7_9HYPO|nr:uncharacterized protein FTOL_13454 [Fusarium torulosum]
MHAEFLIATLAFGGSSVAHILPSSRRGISPRRSGRHERPVRYIEESQKRSEVETAVVASHKKTSNYEMNVDIYVHVVSSSSSRFISIDYLNKAYNPHDIYFNHVSTGFHVNGNWSSGVVKCEEFGMT